MKVKPNQFRALIKESIRELIEEGAFSDVVKECVQEMLTEGGSFANFTSKALEEQAAIQKGLIKNVALDQKAAFAARMFAPGKDEKTIKLYEEIFSDAAQTTLQRQLSQELRGGNTSGADLVMSPTNNQIQQDQVELESFGSMDRWAKVAFAAKKSPSGNY